jgi:hypothetical protein
VVETVTEPNTEQKVKIVTWKSPAKFGGIQNFHCYDGQDEDKHGQFDTASDLHMEPKNTDSFIPIVGAIDAIDKCAVLANYWEERRPWDGDKGVQQWLDREVFQLDHATKANKEVSF